MSPKEPFTGLFEPDPAGTVLYYSPETNGDERAPLPDIIGRNLYTDIPVAQSFQTIREHLNSFHLSREQTQSFVFPFQFEDHLLPMKIMLTRVCNESKQDPRELILIQITRA